MRKSEYILYEREEAKSFYAAYPIGNGSLGGTVYGTLPKMRLGLNHDTLWSGDVTVPYAEYKEEDYLAAREMAMRGDYFGATSLISQKIGKYDAACYQTAGDIFFDFGEGEITDYRRLLNVRSAVADVRFSLNGSFVCVSHIASYPDGVIYVHILSEKELDFSLSADMPLVTDRKRLSHTLVLNGECPIASERQIAGNSLPPELVGKRGVSFSCAVGAVSDGTVTFSDMGIHITAATDTTIAIGIATSYANGNAHGKDNFEAEVTVAVSQALTHSYADALVRHAADVHEYFDRVEIHLGEEDCSDLPTSERIASFADENGVRDADLITLSYNLSRYLLIASSRKGSTPPNLQGIWNDSPNPPWCGNYTTNINLEMNYWGAFSSGLFDLFEPLENYANLLAERGAALARSLYGARGFAVHHNSDIFGYCGPVTGKTRWLFFPFAGAWIVAELFRKYEYTWDKDYLARIFPLLEGCAHFALDTLIEDGAYLIFAPAGSPENDFLADGAVCEVARSSTMFAALIRECLQNYVTAAHLLGRDSEDVRAAEEALPRLLPLRLTEDGRIEEWYFGDRAPTDFAEKDPRHRHISHLYDLYPAQNITLSGRTLAEAAKKSLDARDGEAMGWSAVWRMCCRARLGDGEAVLKLLRMYFRYVPADTDAALGVWMTGVYCNLLSAHPFQIDANLGFAAAVAEMLVGERDGRVVPLPALPQGITSGEVRGLYIRGNRRVDMTFSGGTVTELKVY